MGNREFSVWTAEVARVGVWSMDGRMIESLDVSNGWVSVHRCVADSQDLVFIGSACIAATGEATIFTEADDDIEGLTATITLRDFPDATTSDDDEPRFTFTNARPGYVVVGAPRPAWPDLSPCHLVRKVTPET